MVPCSLFNEPMCSVAAIVAVPAAAISVAAIASNVPALLCTSPATSEAAAPSAECASAVPAMAVSTAAVTSPSSRSSPQPKYTYIYDGAYSAKQSLAQRLSYRPSSLYTALRSSKPASLISLKLPAPGMKPSEYIFFAKAAAGSG